MLYHLCMMQFHVRQCTGSITEYSLPVIMTG